MKVKARLRNYFRLKETKESCQLNATYDADLGPFILKDHCWDKNKTRMGPED